MNGYKAWLLAALSVLMSGAVRAEQCRVGEVVRVVGTVSVQRTSSNFVPFVGVKVCRGDRLVTGAGSIAEVRLRDGTLITVGKSSEFVFREYRIYKNKPNVALFDLVSGAFRSVTGSITARAHRFEVHSRVATIGVRGTDFWGGYGLTDNGLDVIMLSGHGIYIDSASGGHVEISTAGQGTTVVEGSAPTAGSAWGADKVQRAVATITP